MPVILQSEKKQTSSRLIYLLLYMILAVGSVSMVYPFLLMASGSFKSRLDVQDLDIIPRYWHDDSMLYRKYIESKYNEAPQEYNDASGNNVRNFRQVDLPETSPALLEDWVDFVATSELPLGWFLTAFGPTSDGKIIQNNERAFRNYVTELCGGDLAVFQERFEEPLESWFFLKFPPERLTDRKYQLGGSGLIQAFYEFKDTLELKDRIYVSCDSAFRKYLKLSWNGKGGDFLPPRSNGAAWENYVRTFLHPQFILVEESYRPSWSLFLKEKYKDLSYLNKLYSDSYSNFSEVPFPVDKLTASSHLSDFLLFISNPEKCPKEALVLDTPEIRWREYLNSKYGNASSLSASFGKEFENLNKVGMPQELVDLEHVLKNESTIRWGFISNNYLMVLEYILYYGSGIKNTLIYCLSSIGLALFVNPIAAYALSRYNLSGQYKILLFLIATMAFPEVVAMIPNFLLLRDLGLLNTFFALLLPSMANGYSIFLLKGFFDSLPKELFEAADIDGANEWQKFWMITMNLSKPILAVIALGAFNAAYSNFMYAFILCQDKDMWTLSVWLYQLQQFSSQGVVYASLMIAAIPTLIIFVLCQNVILRGIVVPTEK